MKNKKDLIGGKRGTPNEPNIRWTDKLDILVKHFKFVGNWKAKLEFWKSHKDLISPEGKIKKTKATQKETPKETKKEEENFDIDENIRNFMKKIRITEEDIPYRQIEFLFDKSLKLIKKPERKREILINLKEALTEYINSKGKKKYNSIDNEETDDYVKKIFNFMLDQIPTYAKVIRKSKDWGNDPDYFANDLEKWIEWIHRTPEEPLPQKKAKTKEDTQVLRDTINKTFI